MKTLTDFGDAKVDLAPKDDPELKNWTRTKQRSPQPQRCRASVAWKCFALVRSNIGRALMKGQAGERGPRCPAPPASVHGGPSGLLDVALQRLSANSSSSGVPGSLTSHRASRCCPLGAARRAGRSRESPRPDHPR